MYIAKYLTMKLNQQNLIFGMNVKEKDYKFQPFH